MQDILISTIPVSAINLADTGFRISRVDAAKTSALAASMAEVGMIVPPLVTGGGTAPYTVVSGFKRLEAALLLGWDTIACRIGSGLSAEDLARLAVAENAFQRELGAGDQVRAAALLARYMDAGQMSKQAVALFNTRYNSGYINRLVQIQNLPDPALALLDEGRLSIKAAVSLTGFDPGDAAAFLGLFAAVKLSSSKQMDIITWIREICAREKCLIPELVAAFAPKAPPEDSQGHKDLGAEGNLLRARLYNRRYPALDQARKEAAARVQALKLPPAVRLTLPENFESMVYSLSLAFTTPEAFQDQVRALGKLSGSEAFIALLNRQGDINPG